MHNEQCKTRRNPYILHLAFGIQAAFFSSLLVDRRNHRRDARQGLVRLSRVPNYCLWRSNRTNAPSAELSSATMTPPRLVELRCPACKATHWIIDSDFRGSALMGMPEASYDER